MSNGGQKYLVSSEERSGVYCNGGLQCVPWGKLAVILHLYICAPFLARTFVGLNQVPVRVTNLETVHASLTAESGWR